jgi:hypothetical protein
MSTEPVFSLKNRWFVTAAGATVALFLLTAIGGLIVRNITRPSRRKCSGRVRRNHDRRTGEHLPPAGFFIDSRRVIRTITAQADLTALKGAATSCWRRPDSAEPTSLPECGCLH